MLQPAGRVCGLDASLRIYLRSSLIVCAVDAVFILVRFAFYVYNGHGVNWAARAILATRGPIDEDSRPEDATSEDPKPGRFLSQQRNYFLLSLVFGVGVLTQFVKLMACSGVPWTQVWACFYMLSFVVVEVTKRLGRPQKDAKTKPTENEVMQRQQPWIDWWEQACGYAAIILQLGILASVDMKAMPPDPILKRRWIFICARFTAHFAVCLVHLPFMILNIDGRKTLPDHHWGFLLMSILVPYIIIASTQHYRFSQLYFIVSIIISYFSWMLYFFPVTKMYVLLCEPQNRGRKNLLAFDFCCRILCFSLIWYAVHYDPTGTVKTQWTNYLG